MVCPAYQTNLVFDIGSKQRVTGRQGGVPSNKADAGRSRY